MEPEQQGQPNQRFLSTQDLDKFKHELNTALSDYLTQQLGKNTEDLLERMTEMLKEYNNEDATTSTDYDEDHDVIMRNGITSSVTPVPDPGLFSGNTNETKLFCELCESIINTYPYNQLTEAEKKNFITSRLRGSARTWYQIKFKNAAPNTARNILIELSQAFSNVTSIKLAKIQLVELRQSYGKIDEYIEKFRNYSCRLEIDDASLTLLFLNGLHPKYKNEIKKADVIPETLEEMITKCILFENSLKLNNKLNSQANNKKHNNRDHNNRNHNNRIPNNNYDSGGKSNKNFSKNYNHNGNNSNNNINAQKISSQN